MKNNTKLPMPSNDELLKNKKYDAREYAMLMSESKYNKKERHRYVYKNQLNLEEKAKEMKISAKTLQRNIKRLTDLEQNVLDIEKTENGIIYKLNYKHDDKNYVTVHHDMLKKLSASFNSTAIKLYCILKYVCNEKDFTQVTNSWLIEKLGLCVKNSKNSQLIHNITEDLMLTGYIQYKIKHINDGINTKKLKYYKINSFEEWEKYRKEHLKIK